MEAVLKRLEDVKKTVSDDLKGGEFESNKTHLKGMITGIELAIKIVKSEMEVF